MNRFLSNKKYNKNNNNKNNVEKMDFPELIISKKNSFHENNNSYKNIINTEVIDKKESLPEGYIILKEGIIHYPKKENNIDELQLFYNNIISTQIYLDKVHEDYKNHFIELYGEDLYNKYYKMTDSHIYIEKEEEEEEEIYTDEDDDYNN
jgi:hypothetical protein